MADIGGSKVDVVVVYKIDRLTRSLLDFAKIVEVFDAHDDYDRHRLAAAFGEGLFGRHGPPKAGAPADH